MQTYDNLFRKTTIGFVLSFASWLPPTLPFLLPICRICGCTLAPIGRRSRRNTWPVFPTALGCFFYYRKNAENRSLSVFSVNSICCNDYSATLNSLMVPVSEENTVPILKSLRPSASYGRAYPLSSICCKASSAVPSSLNSKM